MYSNFSTAEIRPRSVFEWAFRASFTAFAIWLILFRTPGLEGDTSVVIQGWSDIVACIRSGHFAPCPTVSYFAALQTFAVTPFRLLGALPPTTLRLFAFFSVLGSVLLMYCGYQTLKRSSTLCARLLLLAALASPLIYYSGSSFSELWLCCLLMLLVASCVSGHPKRIAILTFLAGTAKETTPPFALALALCSLLWAAPIHRRFLQKFWLYPVAGTAAAMFANTLLNVFRYGSVFNSNYWDPAQHVHNTWDYASFVLGLWFSPNGGFFFYWPVLALCTALALAGSFIHYTGKKTIDARVLPLAAMCVFHVVLTLGLANWSAPFGWICWGSRIHLPWLLPTAFFLWIVYAAETEAFAHRYFRSAGLRILMGLVLAISSMPHLFVTLNDRILLDVFRLTTACPKLPSVSDSYYYTCMHSYIWPSSSTLVRSFGLISWDVRTIAVSGLFLCTCLFGFASLPLGTAKLREKVVQ